MLHPQLVIYEQDGSLERVLRDLATARRWALREPRRPASCYEFLERGCPGVLVVKLTAKAAPELELLEHVHWYYPDTARVAVTEGDDPPLAGLARHLGAEHALAAVQARDHLPAVVAGLMEAACALRPGGRGGARRAP
jgi:hypothetical protein